MPKKIVAKNKKSPKQRKEPFGRPTKYNPEVAQAICDAVAVTTKGLKHICDARDDFPCMDTVNEWRYKYPDFSAKYAQAKLQQAELLAEEILEISDNCVNDVQDDKFNPENVQRSRLRVDTRKWLASKLLPKAYGDRKSELEEDTASQLLEILVPLIKKHEREY